MENQRVSEEMMNNLEMILGKKLIKEPEFYM